MNRIWQGAARPIILAVLIWALAVYNLAGLALVVVIALEWPAYRRLSLDELLVVVPEVVVGLSAVAVIALLPRAVSQLAVAFAYLVWRMVLAQPSLRARLNWAPTAVAQASALEALFLWAAIDHPSRLLVLLLLFASSFVIVYGRLREMAERAAAVLAATWAVIVIEAAWVFLSWLVSYVVAGGYLVVPQPTIILCGLAYCAGNIFLAGKRGELSRARLGEYLIITTVLVLIVAVGTGWRGTI